MIRSGLRARIAGVARRRTSTLTALRAAGPAVAERAAVAAMSGAYLVPGAPTGMLAERQSFQVSLPLPDGSKVIGGRRHGDADPTGPILWPRGG